jgi:hypothetical protein
MAAGPNFSSFAFLRMQQMEITGTPSRLQVKIRLYQNSYLTKTRALGFKILIILDAFQVLSPGK